MFNFFLLKRVIGKVQCLREKNLNSDGIKEVSSKGRDISNLQTGKDANIMRKIYQSSRFMIIMLSGNKKYTFSRFQLYARAYVRIKDATPLLT